MGIVSQNFPYPYLETASSLTDRDDRDGEEEEDDTSRVIKLRGLTPQRPAVPPFLPVEGNVPKLRVWLVQQFNTSSFNTSSAPLATMTGVPMKIHIDPKAIPVAAHKPIPIPHH